MYLYENNEGKSINIYNFVPNKIELIEYKKRYLEDIKSAILHVNNTDTEGILFDGQSIMFSALDRKEDNGEISYIEETNSFRIIYDYIYGKFDLIDPISVVGDVPSHKSFYSGNINNQDSCFLFEGGSYYDQREFRSSESVLLTGKLALLQPLLSNRINNLVFSEFLNDLDDKTIEFLQLFSCKKLSKVSLESLQLLRNDGLINFDDYIYDAIEKSEIVLKNYRRVRSK